MAERRLKDPDKVKLPRRPSLPKAIKGGPIFGRGPLALYKALSKPEHVSGVPPKPEHGPLSLATLPEWSIYWALTERLKKVPNVDFTYREEIEFISSLALGAQLDFMMQDGSQIAIEVQGVYWHYEQGSQKIAEDEYRRALIANAGWKIVNIDEDDAVRDPLFYTREALEGREHAYRTGRFFTER